MTAITDLSDVINRLTGGNSGTPEHLWFFKDARIGAAASNAPVIGFLQSLWLANGTPSRASAAPGVPATTDRTTQGGLKQANPGGGRQKWLLGLEGFSSQPGVLILYDRLLHNSTLDGTSTNPQVVQGNANTGAFTCTSASPGVLTLTAHGFPVGQKVRLTNSGGALPTGFSTLTDYYVCKTTYAANTFTLSTSYANAFAGTAINTSSTGSGTNTVTGQGPTPALSRYTNGAGNIVLWEVYTQLGATATTAKITYTNQAGTATQVSQLATFGGSTSSLRNVQSAGIFALADGDTGVEAVSSVTLTASTTTAGEFGITIAHPLASIGMGVGGTGAARDLISGFPASVEIPTDACLGLLWMPAIATAPIITGAIHSVEA